jgi:signal transduction histidine kinase
MSPLEVLQLIGYSTGAALHLWLCAVLWRQRPKPKRIERALFALAASLCLWHASNLIIALHGMLGLARAHWMNVLRFADTCAVVSITLAYSFLLHVHLHLWASARGRAALNFTERIRVYLSYIPALFLLIAVPRLWQGDYAPMLEKLSGFVLPFAYWAAYALCVVALTDWLIARASRSLNERRLMQILAASFIGIGALLIFVLAFKVGEGTQLESYLKTIANLASLLPSALLAYYIYRYRYLELIIQESLVIASFAAVILTIYLFGIRTLGLWLTETYGLRTGAIESLLILALALIAAPLRGWIESRFHKLFQREATLYRDIVERINAHAGRFKELPDLLRFVETRTTQTLNLRRMRIYIKRDVELESKRVNSFRTAADVDEFSTTAEWAERIIALSSARLWEPIEAEDVLREKGFELAYILRREDRVLGLLLIDAAPNILTREARALLEVLAAQTAVAIEDSRIVEENVYLEQRLAQGERLAALGQMAATIAHEVKNPLSAIKSIAQVLREDERIGHDYGHDLSLIVGETDRLNHSVTQLLSFARVTPAPTSRSTGGASSADQLIQTIIELFRVEAQKKNIKLECEVKTTDQLDGQTAAATRDALANILLNAIQASPVKGVVEIKARTDEDDDLFITVKDCGAGIARELHERIWEPFFTTKQRGTGLGLAIARKRIEEAGGRVRIVSSDSTGTTFELRVPRVR